MDIDLLSKMVKELILDNDRVVLPGLGSFVAEVVPSTFSDKGYTINPPYRRLFFRSKPDEGSELVSFYASSNQVEHDLAERIIKDFVAELKTILHSKKVVVFPGLGRLRATKENAVFFVADEDLDIYPAGFGLEPISLKTHQETREEVSAAVAGLKSLLEETVQEVPESAPEPIVEPEPAPAVPEPEPVAEPEQKPEPEPELQPVKTEKPAAPTVVEETSRKRTATKPGVLALTVLAVLAAVLIIALAIIGRTAPDLVDHLLYTPEELKILNYTIK
jgi:nucleoid DNA-binding protein